jgi:hypothetical protein
MVGKTTRCNDLTKMAAAPTRGEASGWVMQQAIPANAEGVGRHAHVDDERAALDV